jgi:circadian clock protein KaiB
MSPTRKTDGAAPPKHGERAAPAHGSRGDDGTIQAQLAAALGERDQQRYVLRLYVTGLTPTSRKAIERVRTVCEKHLHGRYELDVIDIYQRPALAKDEQIIATPTLIKVLPAPLRRYIGNLASVERVLFGLDLHEKR